MDTMASNPFRKGGQASLPCLYTFSKLCVKPTWEYDRELYRERNLIERAFNKLKQWRRIATRYDRKSLYFLSALHLVASVIWG